LAQKKVTSECSTQSEVHIIDKHIDPNYRWNEWDLRRKALELVNLKKKLTHSTQTALSHFKRDSETQCYPQKYILIHKIDFEDEHESDCKEWLASP